MTAAGFGDSIAAGTDYADEPSQVGNGPVLFLKYTTPAQDTRCLVHYLLMSGGSAASVLRRSITVPVSALKTGTQLDTGTQGSRVVKRAGGSSQVDAAGARKVIESLQVLRNVYLTVLDAINLDLAPSGLSLTEVYALLALADSPDNRIGMSDMSEILHLPRSTATYTAKAMELRGLVCRVHPAGDKRNIDLVLTIRGHRVLATALSLFDLASMRRLFEQTSQGEWFGFTENAAEVMAGLETLPVDLDTNGVAPGFMPFLVEPGAMSAPLNPVAD